jgi:hypothetical protein
MIASFVVKTQKKFIKILERFAGGKTYFYPYILNWKPIIHFRNWMWAMELTLNARELIWAAGCHY